MLNRASFGGWNLKRPQKPCSNFCPNKGKKRSFGVKAHCCCVRNSPWNHLESPEKPPLDQAVPKWGEKGGRMGRGKVHPAMRLPCETAHVMVFGLPNKLEPAFGRNHCKVWNKSDNKEKRGKGGVFLQNSVGMNVPLMTTRPGGVLPDSSTAYNSQEARTEVG